MKKLLSVFFVLISIISCSENKPEQRPGRCEVNADCPQGFECHDTFCEDIYFPRKEIKNY